MRLALVLLWLCAGASAAVAQEARETRVALVIGNGAYASVSALDNPPRDAQAIAKALREVGFQTVQVENNLSREAMLKALRRFEDAVDQADWALVYYAGHGIEVGGRNYLIPVDARIASDRDVEEEAVSLSQVQKRLENARKLRLVILDACRDNPFLAKMRRTWVPSRSVGRGLAVPDLPQTGSLVAYAAAAGQVALDGQTNATNSPYAAALVKNLAQPDVEINLFFRRVRVDVLRATSNKQEPATYESLPDDRFVLRPAPSTPPNPVPLVTPPSTPRPAPTPGPVAALAPVTLTPSAEELRKASEASGQAEVSPQAQERERPLAQNEAEKRRTREQEQAQVVAELDDERRRTAEELQRVQHKRAQGIAREQVLQGPRAPPVQIANLPGPGPIPPAATQDRVTLTRSITRELERVGCYHGPLDASWSGTATTRAVRRFARLASLDPPDLPTGEFLKQLKGHPGRVCPLVCPPRQIVRGGACVAKTCPRGERLDADGDCIAPSAKPTPPPRRVVQHAEPVTRTVRPKPHFMTPARSVPIRANRPRCFSVEGKSFCE